MAGWIMLIHYMMLIFLLPIDADINFEVLSNGLEINLNSHVTQRPTEHPAPLLAATGRLHTQGRPRPRHKRQSDRQTTQIRQISTTPDSLRTTADSWLTTRQMPSTTNSRVTTTTMVGTDVVTTLPAIATRSGTQSTDSSGPTGGFRTTGQTDSYSTATGTPSRRSPTTAAKSLTTTTSGRTDPVTGDPTGSGTRTNPYSTSTSQASTTPDPQVASTPSVKINTTPDRRATSTQPSQESSSTGTQGKCPKCGPKDSTFGTHGVLAFTISLAFAFLMLYALITCLCVMPRISAWRSKKKTQSEIETQGFRRRTSDLELGPAQPMLAEEANGSLHDGHDAEPTEEPATGQTLDLSVSVHDDQLASESSANVSTFLLRHPSITGQDANSKPNPATTQAVSKPDPPQELLTQTPVTTEGESGTKDAPQEDKKETEGSNPPAAKIVSDPGVEGQVEL